ncbi:Ig-like domain-containing protein [Alkaliflexus imshenetskii]|uniref:Ig-like domain-containing protein n=1 Tax=Alkaliflexus imshenetskii TaxID=286730 RepID=UPI0004ADA6BB|nr:Ig-like domain-containing protein [Alkaliflexus imshenetskii]
MKRSLLLCIFNLLLIFSQVAFATTRISPDDFSLEANKFPLSYNSLWDDESHAVAVTIEANKLSYSNIGETITYTITVTNIGTSPLTNVAVTDILENTTTNMGPLAPAEFLTTTRTHSVTQANIDNGSVANSASVTSTEGANANSTILTIPANQITTVTATINSSSPSNFSTPGESITYNVTIQNTGNVTLNNINVTGTKDGSTLSTIGIITPGSSETINFTYITTQSDIDAGSVVNAAKVTSAQITETTSGSVTTTATQTRTVAPNITNATPGSFATTGTTITYSVSVENTGNVTLTNLSVTGTKSGSTVATITSLAPGATANTSFTYNTTQSDIDAGSVVNAAKVTSAQITETTSGSVTTTATQTRTVAANITNATPGSFATTETTITYSVSVENTGNVTLTNLSVTGTKSGSTVATITSLAPGATANTSFTYNTTQSDLDAGSVVNAAKVTSAQITETTSGSVTTTATQTKTVTASINANKSSYSLVGETITYTITVNNTGNVTLTNIVVTDALSSTQTIIPSILPGASATSTRNHVVTQTNIDNGSIVNSASITSAEGATGNTGNFTLNALKDEGVVAVMSANKSQYSTVGETINYTITVTNTGNITLTNVTVVDILSSTQTTFASIAPNGGVATTTRVHSVTQQNIDNGQLVNSATINSTQNVTGSTGNFTITAQQNKVLTVSVNHSPSTFSTVGETITYNIEVRNTGNTTLSTITATDNLTGLNQNLGTLAPNAASNFATTYNVNQNDITNGSVTNTITATSGALQFPKEHIVNAVQNPALNITVTPSKTTYRKAGEAISYNISVTNTGNVPLTNINVNESLTSYNNVVVSLMPNTSFSFVTNYTTTTNDLNTGVINNSVSATTVFGSTNVLRTVTSSINVNASDIALTLLADKSTPNVGEQVAYTITVLNNGPDNATNLSASTTLSNGLNYHSHQTSTGTYISTTGQWNIGNLNAGSQVTLIITTVVNTPGAGITYNHAVNTTVDQHDPITSNNQASVTITPQQANLSITKTANELNPNVGHQVTFTLTAGNEGPHDATGVIVNDLLPSGLKYFNHLTATGSYNAATGIWNIGGLSSGTTATLSISATVETPGSGINFINTASISGVQYDPGTTNNTSQVEITPQQSDLSISKTVNIERPLVNNEVVFTVTASNNGPNTATTVIVADKLPGGFSYIGHNAAKGTYDANSGNWNVGTLNSGEATTLAITALVKEPSDELSYLNVALISADQFDQNTTNNSAQASAIPQKSNLKLTKSVNNNTPVVNEEITFTITLTNSGPDNATGIEITDVVPVGYGAISAISGNGTATGNTIRWTGLTLNNGATVQTSFKAIVQPPSGTIGEYTNMAQVTKLNQFDPDHSDNLAYLTPNINNTPPVANPNVYTTNEDTPLAVTVENGLLSNDTDIDGDALTVVSFSIGAQTHTAGTTATFTHGKLTINANGSLTYEPALNYFGTTSGITYTITDGKAYANANLTFTVLPVNDPPVANDDFLYTAEGTPANMNVLANDNDDADGILGGINPATLRITRQPVNGTIIILPNYNINYTPHVGFFGEDNAEYEICDKGHPLPPQCSRATIHIFVARRSPLAVNDIAETNEDESVNIDILANDIDTDINPATVNIVIKPKNGTAVYLGNGIVKYTPNQDYNGTDFFTYTVRDFTNLISNEARVDITIHPVPDPPVALDGWYSTPENKPIAIPINELVTDPDNDVDFSTLIIVTEPESGVLESGSTNQEVIYTPKTGFAGVDFFEFYIYDSTGLMSNTARVTIQISDQAPVAVDDAVTINEDETTIIHVLSNDTDPQDNIDPTTVSIITQPTRGSAVPNPDGTITYTPNKDYYGTDSFVYRVCDLTGYCDEARVSITILPVNDAPVAEDDHVTILQGSSVFIDVLANDFDVDNSKDELKLSIITEPANGSAQLVASPAGIFYVPDPWFSGSDSFTYRVTDTEGLWDEATVYITVTWVNSPPTAMDDTFGPISGAGMTLNILQNDTDPDENIDPSSVSIITHPEHGQVTVNTNGTVFYLPEPDFFGNDSFVYSVCDMAGECDMAVVTLFVVAGNGPPTANDVHIELDEDTPTRIEPLTNDTDPNNNIDPASIKIISGPLHGKIEFTSDAGSLLYTPNADFYGEDAFVYEVCDSGEPVYCDQATVYITIRPVNDAPRPMPDVMFLYDNTSATINLLDNDFEPEGEEMTAVLISDDVTEYGKVTLAADGTFTFEAFPGKFHNIVEVHYLACDPHGACAESFVTIHIEPLDTDGDGIPDHISIPSTFSPNNDGVNDKWIIHGIEEIANSELSVFNRWGSLVYSKSPYDNSWDGRASTSVLGSQVLPEGTYFYILKINDRYFKGSVYIKW